MSDHKIIARINNYQHSFSRDYAHFDVTFNLVHDCKSGDSPSFVMYENDADVIKSVMVGSQVSKDFDDIYGYAFQLDTDHCDGSIEKMCLTLKFAKKIQRRLIKAEEKSGYCRNHQQYLNRVFDAIGVDHIIYQDKYQWRQFSISDFNNFLYSKALNDVNALIDRELAA
jgi:hypothetical protein